jgi:hypothetical protein
MYLPYSAGIDIGSRSHSVAIGQNAEDAIMLCEWLNSRLKKCGIFCLESL